MLRTILAIVLGAVTAVLTISLVEFAMRALHPLPPGVSTTNTAALAAYAASLPASALVMVLFGWVLGAFDGALLAALVSRAHKRVAALVVGALVSAAVIANSLMLPHPVWMTALGVVLPVAAAYGAFLLASRMAALKASVAGP